MRSEYDIKKLNPRPNPYVQKLSAKKETRKPNIPVDFRSKSEYNNK